MERSRRIPGGANTDARGWATFRTAEVPVQSKAYPVITDGALAGVDVGALPKLFARGRVPAAVPPAGRGGP